jgi:hypothetical protein
MRASDRYAERAKLSGVKNAAMEAVIEESAMLARVRMRAGSVA